MTMKIEDGEVAIGDNGYRIGQSHPKAVLSDVEVEALVCDRGPDDSPLMSYTQLATKYGISKSSVRDIVTGRRRGQAKKIVKRIASKKLPQGKVRFTVSITRRARAILHRMGSGKIIELLAMRVDSELRCAPTDDANEVIARITKRMVRL